MTSQNDALWNWICFCFGEKICKFEIQIGITLELMEIFDAVFNNLFLTSTAII